MLPLPSRRGDGHEFGGDPAVVGLEPGSPTRSWASASRTAPRRCRRRRRTSGRGSGIRGGSCRRARSGRTGSGAPAENPTPFFVPRKASSPLPSSAAPAASARAHNAAVARRGLCRGRGNLGELIARMRRPSENAGQQPVTDLLLILAVAGQALLEDAFLVNETPDQKSEPSAPAPRAPNTSRARAASRQDR